MTDYLEHGSIFTEIYYDGLTEIA